MYEQAFNSSDRINVTASCDLRTICAARITQQQDTMYHKPVTGAGHRCSYRGEFPPFSHKRALCTLP